MKFVASIITNCANFTSRDFVLTTVANRVSMKLDTFRNFPIFEFKMPYKVATEISLLNFVMGILENGKKNLPTLMGLFWFRMGDE